ncbi:amidohydrolase [Myxococcota bacterium]|nr:amidohydrolase [Myxococcota bacterium]
MPSPTGRSYQVISADSHVVEPPDLWEKWLPEKFRDRAPKLVKDSEGGDAWLYDPNGEPAPLGLVSCVAIPREKMKWTGFRYGDNVHASVHDGKERLAVLDFDGVDAEFLYPPQRAVNSFALYDDVELQLAGIGAYNRWLSEGFCAADPDRLFGVAQMPNVGIDTAVSSLRDAAAAGFRGVVISAWPSGNEKLTRADDPFWAAAEELGIPVSIHFGLASQTAGHVPAEEAAGAIGAVTGMVKMSVLMVDLIFSGVFDRFPGLQIVAVEVGIGWIPHAAEMMDDRYWRNRTGARTMLNKLPSVYLKENWTSSYIVDRIGIQVRHAVGINNICWSTDFPHHGNDYPYSRETIDNHFTNVPEDERDKILAGNAARLYGMV